MQRGTICRSLPQALLVGLLLTSVAWGEGVAVEAATSEQLRQAQTAFQAADELFDVQQYAEALEKYRASYGVVASPNSRLMIARCLRELGRLDEAYAEYDATLTAAEELARTKPQYKQTVKSARDELQALRTRVALLSVTLGDVPPESEITVGGKQVDTKMLERPIVVVPGEVVVIAVAPDGQRAGAVTRASAGRESTVTLKLGEGSDIGQQSAETEEAAPVPGPSARHAKPEVAAVPPPESDSSLKTYAYVAGGVGAAGLVAFGVFGMLNNAKYDELDEQCPDGHCAPDRSDDIDQGRLYQTLANVGAVVGVVGLGAGVALFYLGSTQESEPQAAVRVGPGSLTVSGRF